MKKLRMFFGAIAFVFAFASAFAFQSTPTVQNPSYVNSEGDCIQVSVASCSGGTKDCKRDVGGQSEIIRDFQSISSCTLLQMP